MMQSLDRQLQVVLRALSDTLAPALAEAEKHVVEQLHLSIATLSFVAQRMPDARAFARYELRSYVDMAVAAADAAGDAVPDDASALREKAHRAHALLDRADADTQALEDGTRACREAIAAFSTAVHATSARQAVERIVMELSGPVIAQSRQWCAPFGFELKPQDLPAPAWITPSGDQNHG